MNSSRPEFSLSEPGRALQDHRFFAHVMKDEALSKLVPLLLGMGEGERLPSERELAESLHVSRTALRDRIGKLESLGILQRRERLGTFFTGIRPEHISDVLILSMLSSPMTVDSLVSVRRALERQAAIEACRARNLPELEKLALAVRKMHESDDGFTLYEADNEFHEHLFAASDSEGLIFFSKMLHAVLSGTVQKISLERDRGTLRTLHSAIFDAVNLGQEKAAGQAMEDHFDWLDALMDQERDEFPIPLSLP